MLIFHKDPDAMTYPIYSHRLLDLGSLNSYLISSTHVSEVFPESVPVAAGHTATKQITD